MCVSTLTRTRPGPRMAAGSRMNGLADINIDRLEIINYPDPRLREACLPVEAFDERLGRLIERLFELMARERGVGLAAPQIGVPLRLFACNPTGEPEDRRYYVNPEPVDLEGAVEGDEGCLSIPELTVPIRRAQRCTLRAFDMAGQPVEVRGEDLEARIWQHETDHLNGVLIIDKMSPASKIASRRILKKLEEDFRTERR